MIRDEHADQTGVSGCVEDANSKAPIGARRATGIILASAIAAASSLLITIISARSLSVEANKEFLVFWALMFGIFGIIAGTQTESTRAANAGRLLKARGENTSKSARVLDAALILGTVCAVLVAASSWLWAPRLVASTMVIATIVISFGVIGYAGQMSISGCFAGLKSWNFYSALMAGEAAVRLVLVLVIAFFASSLTGFEIASAIPAFLWLAFLLTRKGQKAASARADVTMARLIKFNLHAMLSSAAWAVLVTGFATMLDLTSPGEDPAVLATTILAVTLTRSPIMIPLQAFQGVLITWIADSAGRKLGSVLKIMAALAALGAVLSLFAAWLGPWLMRLLFGDVYDTPWWVLGGLMLAAISMAWLVLSGATTVALNEHRSYALGWVAAAICAFIILWILPFDVQVRTIITLVSAPLIGVLIHLRTISVHDKNFSSAKN